MAEQKPISAGKGDKQRPTDVRKFARNYDEIDWGKPKRFGVWSITLRTWVMDEDGEIVVHESRRAAEETLARIHDLKQLNPRYKKHLYEVKEYVDGWCCNQLKNAFTLTIDDQDIRELYNGNCPFCLQKAIIGKSRPKPRQVSLEDAFKTAEETWID